jgi:S1-C subfamily serine protease
LSANQARRYVENKMDLVESYQNIKPSIVAFAPKFYKVKPPDFPIIFGTGFIVADGLIATNDHVFKYFSKLYKPDDFPKDLWPVDCFLFYQTIDKGIVIVKLDVIGVFGVKDFQPGENYFGPNIPDIAFVFVKMRKLPFVTIKYDLRHIKEGREIATAGFPMGSDTLTAPGYLHQLTPTLQNGIISAVLPYPCEKPHAIMINVMVQGGASGSPVFLPETGDVIGILYAGLEEDRKIHSKLPFDDLKNVISIEPSIHSHIYNVPTNISYIMPAHYIEIMLNSIHANDNYHFPDDTPNFDEYIKDYDGIKLKPKEPIPFKKWEEMKPEEKHILKIKPNEKST